MRTSQRRQALNDIFDTYEEMTTLLSCLARSPALWHDDEDDEEQEIIKDNLIAKGLLTAENGFCTTTPAGCEALIAYIRGEDEEEDTTYDLESEDE